MNAAAALLLAAALAHVVIDVRGWPAWGRRFRVNAIAADAGSSLMVLAWVALDGWWWDAKHWYLKV